MPRDTSFHAAARDLLVNLSDALIAATDPQWVVTEAVTRCVGALDADFGKVLELLPGGAEFRLAAGVGWTPGLVGSATLGAGWDSQSGYALMHPDSPIFVTDLNAEHRFRSPLFLSAHAVRAGISAVIPGTDGPWGVLGIHWRERQEFNQEQACFIRAVANMMGLSLAHHGGATPHLSRRSPEHYVPPSGRAGP